MRVKISRKSGVNFLAKSDNLLAILWMLQSGKKVTAHQISEHLEMNVRTVYRYIETLCSSGVPIVAEAGHHGGYTLLDHFKEAPLYFDLEEQASLYHAATFASEAGYYGNEALSRAIAKINRNSSDRQNEEVQGCIHSLEVINNRKVDPSESVPHLRDIERTIARQFSITIKYRSKNARDAQIRLVDPYKIIYWRNTWYVIGRCHLRDAIRSFRIDRIEHLSLTEVQFDRPADFSGTESFLQNLLPNTVNHEAMTELVIEGNESAIEEMCCHWYLKNCLKHQGRRQAVFTLEQSVLDDQIPGLIIAFGKSIRVIGPVDFRNKVVEHLLELVEFHR